MKLSNKTVDVLKNFSTINQNLIIKEGNTLTTMSAMKNIVAKAEVEQTFPKEVAIYDLNEFLGHGPGPDAPRRRCLPPPRAPLQGIMTETPGRASSKKGIHVYTYLLSFFLCFFLCAVFPRKWAQPCAAAPGEAPRGRGL